MGIHRRCAGFLEGLFTRQERKALAFLLWIGFFGLGVMAWRGCLPAWLRGPPEKPAGAAAAEMRVNRAGPAELAALPGIGPVLAQRIVEDRRRRGFYLTVGDLRRVKGITSRTLRRMKGLVRFD